MERIDTLQAGRAIAALGVVVHHSALAVHDFGGVSHSVLEYGWVGVDFFFVLSGFIIAFSVEGKKLDEYVWHRVRRVLLPYWPIGLGIALLYTILPSISAGNRDWDWLVSLTLLPYGKPALSVAWTLQHELVFYTVFALAWVTRHMVVLAIWGLLCCWPNDWIALEPINLEFLMGVTCFHAMRAGIGSRWLYAVALLPLAAWIVDGAQRGHSLLLGLSFAIMLPALIRTERNGFRIPRPLVFLGGASYSIYLAHGLAISLAARVFAEIGWCAAIGTAGGLAYYWIVERTILRHVPKTVPRAVRSKPVA